MTLPNHAGFILKGSLPGPATKASWLKTPSASREAKEYRLKSVLAYSTARYRRRHSLVHGGSSPTIMSRISGRGDG
jgi:hypothetical protein